MQTYIKHKGFNYDIVVQKNPLVLAVVSIEAEEGYIGLIYASQSFPHKPPAEDCVWITCDAKIPNLHHELIRLKVIKPTFQRLVFQGKNFIEAKILGDFQTIGEFLRKKKINLSEATPNLMQETVYLPKNINKLWEEYKKQASNFENTREDVKKIAEIAFYAGMQAVWSISESMILCVGSDSGEEDKIYKIIEEYNRHFSKYNQDLTDWMNGNKG